MDLTARAGVPAAKAQKMLAHGKAPKLDSWTRIVMLPKTCSSQKPILLSGAYGFFLHRCSRKERAQRGYGTTGISNCPTKFMGFWGTPGHCQVENENNTKFAMEWLPSFALHPPTEREVKARFRVQAFPFNTKQIVPIVILCRMLWQPLQLSATYSSTRWSQKKFWTGFSIKLKSCLKEFSRFKCQLDFLIFDSSFFSPGVGKRGRKSPSLPGLQNFDCLWPHTAFEAARILLVSNSVGFNMFQMYPGRKMATWQNWSSW